MAAVSDPLHFFAPESLPSNLNLGLSNVKEETIFGHYGKFDAERLADAASRWLAEHTDARETQARVHLSAFIKTAAEDALGPSAPPEACWLTIRAFKPTDEYTPVPRWHQDGRMFECSCSLGPDSGRPHHSKYCTVFLGPNTRLLVSNQEAIAALDSIEKHWLDGKRPEVAAKLAGYPQPSSQPGQMFRMSWGRDDSPIHSEPDMSGSDRVFVSILFGLEAELKSMCEFRDEKYKDI